MDAVSSPTSWRFLVLRAGCLGLLGACRSAAPITAVGLPAVTTSTDPEQMLAVDASLDEKQQVVHRSLTAVTTNLPTPSTSSIVCGRPASIG